MNASDILLLGIKKSVVAIARRTGEIIWSTKLKAGMGQDFVTVLCEGKIVFACCGGSLHALDLFSGAILWTNELKGYGYNLGSLCLPDGGSAPSPALIHKLMADQAAAAAAGASTAAS